MITSPTTRMERTMVLVVVFTVVTALSATRTNAFVLPIPTHSSGFPLAPTTTLFEPAMTSPQTIPLVWPDGKRTRKFHLKNGGTTRPRARRGMDDDDNDNDNYNDDAMYVDEQGRMVQRRSLKQQQQQQIDPMVREIGILLRRLSWFTWWVQLVLTTISALTLLFSRNAIGVTPRFPLESLHLSSSSSPHGIGDVPNFVLAGLGIACSFASLLWTWATRRLARRLLTKRTTRLHAATLLRKSVNVGATMNILGMLLSLISAEQIVGVLAVKVLTSSRTIALAESNSLLQPLDILVVQANTNTLLSHFCTLVARLYLTKSVAKLDPPSIEGKDERPRRFNPPPPSSPPPQPTQSGTR